MKLQFIGVGGAFAPISKGNSNMMFTSDSGKKMILDCGTTFAYIYRDEMKLDFKDIDAIYISHLHGDHVGHLELLAFSRYFIPKKDDKGNIIRPKLYCVPELMQELWETTLKGGLESIEGKVMNLTDYFECIPVQINTRFEWEGYYFYPVQTIHVMSGYKFKNSYGLAIQKQDAQNRYSAFITTDTQFCPYQLNHFYIAADIIFNDCETSPVQFKSHVHAHYEDLNTLSPDIKAKMWLYHYGEKRDADKDGFAGFVEKGQIFEI